MSPNEISIEEAKLLIDKLATESTLVDACLVCADGSYSRIKGFLDSVSNKVGFVVSSIKGRPESADAVLRLTIGDGSTCTFFFGDKREFPKPRDGSTEGYGDTVFIIKVGSTGSILSLFFNSLTS
jgi:hypothetical protein